MSCPSPQPPAPHHYSGAVKLQILVSLFSANSVWMELGTWEEAGHTSKASKVWATGGILIAWAAHKSKHYNSTLYRIQTRVVKAHSYISPLEQGRKIQFDKKNKSLPCFISTNLKIHLKVDVCTQVKRQTREPFDANQSDFDSQDTSSLLWIKTFFKTHWEERWISRKLKQSLANYDVWS